MEFKVGDIVRAIRNTKSISNSNIDVGSIWRVQGIDHSDGEEYDIRIIESNNTTSRYGVWANSEDFEIYEIKEKKDMSTEFKKGDLVTAINTFCQDGRNICNNKIYEVIDIGSATGNLRIMLDDGITLWVPRDKMRIAEKGFKIDSIVECIKTHKVPNVPKMFSDEEILKGETFKIINVDRGDEIDIFVSGINNDKRWWTNSKYFKNLEEKKNMSTEFKMGDYVTAKKTFYYDGEKIVKGHQYEVSDCGRKDGDRIQIDLGPKYWWVPKYKMTPISSSGSAYTGTDVVLKIKDVIYSNPATIVFWDDGTKTVVRCGKGETFDPEKGLAMAISKRVLGSNYAWHGRFNKWLPKNRAEKKDKSKKTKEETPNE